MALLLITMITLVLAAVSVLFFGRARKAARSSGAEDLVSRDEAQRYLAENWALVEKGAREGGMTDEEIARVRANVLGGT